MLRWAGTCGDACGDSIRFSALGLDGTFPSLALCKDSVLIKLTKLAIPL